MLSWGISKSERLIQFPFLMAAVYLGWLLPQLIGVRHSYLPYGALDKTIIMAMICLAACMFGYSIVNKKKINYDWSLSVDRLTHSSVILSVIGSIFYFQVGSLASDVNMNTGGQWSGIITIYSFFGRLLTVGLCIALIVYLSKPSMLSLLTVVYGSIFYLHRIVVLGRRAALIEFALMLAIALWFRRKIVPPRVLILSVIFFATLIINSIGDYRKTMLGDDLYTWSGAGVSEITSINYLQNFKDMFSGEQANHEITNAVLEIAATDEVGSYDYGLSLWNEIINRFVPGQIIGESNKLSMLVNINQNSYMVYTHVIFTGSTLTGLTDSFKSFWYFGALKFLLIAIILKRLWISATLGSAPSQIILMLTASPALHSITHTTHHFFVSLIEVFIFLFPFLLISRLKKNKLNSTQKQRQI